MAKILAKIDALKDYCEAEAANYRSLCAHPDETYHYPTDNEIKARDYAKAAKILEETFAKLEDLSLT
jgi:hypothetical protein